MQLRTARPKVQILPYSMLGYRQVVRQWALNPLFVGSIPTIPKFEVEILIINMYNY